MALAARLDLTADVLQSCKLPSAGEQNSVWTGLEFSVSIELKKKPKKKNHKEKHLTYQLHQSACECMRGMTCASLVGRGDSGSLRQKADENNRSMVSRFHLVKPDFLVKLKRKKTKNDSSHL